MNNAEKHAAQVAMRNIFILLGVKWVVIMGIARAARKAAEQ